MREFLEKYGLRLLAVTTACAVLISVLNYLSATSGFLQNAVGVLTSPFRAAAASVTQWVEDKQRYYKDYSELLAENEELRVRVAELERDARQADADREENALLRELLELSSQRRSFVFEAAAVLILPLIVGIDGVWAAVIAAEALALVLSAACLVRNRKKYGYA